MERRKEQLRKHIETSLGLTDTESMPTATDLIDKAAIEDASSALLGIQEVNNNGVEYADERTEKLLSIRPQCDPSMPDLTPKKMAALFFPMEAAEDDNFQPAEARLKLYLKKPHFKPVTLTVFRVKKNNKLAYVTSKIVAAGISGIWVELDVITAVDRWVLRRKRNYGLAVQITETRSRKPLKVERFVEIDDDECGNEVVVGNSVSAFPSVLMEAFLSTSTETATLMTTDENATEAEISPLIDRNHVPHLDLTLTELNGSYSNETALEDEQEAGNSTESASTTTTPFPSPLLRMPIFGGRSLRRHRTRNGNGNDGQSNPRRRKIAFEEFVKLEKVEEKRFGSTTTTTSPTTSTSTMMRFRPSSTKVLMSHAELMEVLRQALREEEDTIEAERKFLDRLLEERG